MKKSVVYLHPSDNICVASRDLEKGEPIRIGDLQFKLNEAIRIGHKIAVAAIGKDEPVRKFGQIIGFTTQSVQPGDWVHSHNLVNGDYAKDYAKCSAIPPTPSPITGRTFMGYRRPSGKAGTRNYIGVISTVNCSASVSKYAVSRFNTDKLKEFPNVDGVVAFKHERGCGMQYKGTGHQMLNRVLGGIAKHPNIGAYLLIGLGCEQGAMNVLLEDHQLLQISGLPGSNNRPPVFIMQDMGGTVRTVEAAIREIERLLPVANDVKRVSIPASEIILGLECGGSDGNSGVTANPALGYAADMIVACGGTAVLSETSEIYGAEHLLTRRSRTPEVADKLIERIEWWKWYASVFGGELDNNPSVGNKAGGLTTIAEKSLGAVAKGGTTALEDVYHYAEEIKSKGFVVMDTPGYDPPSVTGMVAGGANVVVFTTGRGSCYGCKPVPSIKLASNTPMYLRMEDDMDLNAGTILEGESLESAGSRVFEEVLEVASGKKTKSEVHGIGDEEFVPWFVGPTL